MKKYNVVIVGGGASGLACAVRLNRLSVAIVEAGERLGKKLACTGNGQGNVTNRNMSLDKYFSGNLEIVDKVALSVERKNLEDKLFHLLLQTDSTGRVYPMGRQASSLVDSLIFDIKRGGADIFLNTRVVDIDKNLNITLSTGEILSADYAVICTGGKAQTFKNDFSLYDIAKKLGHKITPLTPSLVQLKTDTKYTRSLKGIRVDCSVTAISHEKVLAKTHGDLIFTDYGVTGNAIFAISPYIVGISDVYLSIDFLQTDDKTVIEDIKNKQSCGYAASELLNGTLHNQLGRAILKRANSVDPHLICNTAKNFVLPVTGTLGFDYAQVTRGGVDMDGVSCDLESKYVKNLYFAGEILDVDGCCGGYNLHWAFASGYAVADSILKKI